LDRQYVGYIGESRRREYHRLVLGGRRIHVDFGRRAAVHLCNRDAGVRASIADPADRRSAERQREGFARCLGLLCSDRYLGQVRDAAASPGIIVARLGPAGAYSLPWVHYLLLSP